jgi:streptogramin lyase
VPRPGFTSPASYAAAPTWPALTRDGRITEFEVPDNPLAIASGSDGAIWITTLGGTGKNGLLRITTGGELRSFYVRQTCDGAVQGLLSAPDGSLLFTEAHGPVAVGRLDLNRLKRTGQLRAE